MLSPRWLVMRPRQAAVFPVAVIGLLLAVKVSWAAFYGGAGQVLFTVALFVLPLLYAFPGGRRLLTRYRWPVLGVQAVLTWVPFAVFGGQWVVGLGGLLAGLVLLLLAGPVSWLLAGLLLAADVAVRAGVTGLEFTPAWSGVVWTIVAFADDGLWFFGMVRLAQVVAEVGQARRQSAELAVARERLQAARALQAAVGERLAGVEFAELQHPGHRGMRRRSRNAKDLRRLQSAREVTRQEADRNTMAGRLVLAEADGPEGTGTDLADDAVPVTYAQAAREPLPALGGRDRRRIRLGFTTHWNNPYHNVEAIHNHG